MIDELGLHWLPWSQLWFPVALAQSINKTLSTLNAGGERIFQSGVLGGSVLKYGVASFTNIV